MSLEVDFDGLKTESQDPLLSFVDIRKVQPKLFKTLNRKHFTAWVLYDVANTFYASGILSFTSLTWIQVIGQRNGMSYGTATYYYSLMLSVASVFMAVLLPILGSLSDVTQQRKNYVTFFTAICLVSTFLFLVLDSFWPVLIVFAISMITYQWAQVFYDAMLPSVVPPGREAKLSSIAITIGYLGGAIITGYGYLLAQNHQAPNADPAKGIITLGYTEQMAYAVIVGFTILAIPIFFVREQNWEEVNALVFLNELDEWQAIYDAFMDQTRDPNDSEYMKNRPSVFRLAKESLMELGDTFKDIAKNNRGMFFYIISYFIIADLANLIAVINIAYLRDGVGLTEHGVYVLVWFSGISLIIVTPIIGVICDKYGAKRGFGVVAFLWFTALVIMMLEGWLLPLNSIYVAAVAIGPALSGVWVCQRQMVLELVPNDEEIGRYFGLTKFSGKLSSAVGPLIFATIFLFVQEIYKNTSQNYVPIAYRWSLFALGLFLALGFYILNRFVPNKSQEFRARKKRVSEIIESHFDVQMELEEAKF